MPTRLFADCVGKKMDWLYYLVLLLPAVGISCQSDIEETQAQNKFKLEGKVSIPNTMNNDWVSTTRVLVDGGQHLGFLRYGDQY